MRWPALAVACCVALLGLAGCYAVRQPPQIGEAVRIEVVSDRGRLVQAQAFLDTAIGDSLVERLGWEVSPVGSARLELSIAQEYIDVSQRDSRGIPNQWVIRLQGTALLVCQKGNIYEHFSGLGYATGLNDQDEGLRIAAQDAAWGLTSWLETETKKLR